MQTFQEEHVNIAAALDYCLADGNHAAALELFTETFLFWVLSGWIREERHYAEALLEATTGRSRAGSPWRVTRTRECSTGRPVWASAPATFLRV